MDAQSTVLDRDKDYSSEDGAYALAAAIKKYWRLRGLFPRVWVQKVLTKTCSSEAPHYTFQVRSHMIGGRPV